MSRFSPRMLLIMFGCLMLSLAPSVRAQTAEQEPDVQDSAAAGDAAPDDKSTEQIETRSVVPDAEAQESWVDRGHGYVTERATALTRWTDDFFGDPEWDAEAPTSRLRLRVTEQWDERFGLDTRIRLGGNIKLPQVSKRLNLVFRGDEERTDLANDPDPAQSTVGVEFQVGNQDPKNYRFDLTMGLSSSGPRPGVKFRYRNNITDTTRYRFIQRMQYEIDDGAFATTKIYLDHDLSASELVRANSRLVWGEETEGLEWNANLSYVSRWSDRANEERASIFYVGAEGRTKPYDYVRNYQVGTRFRFQAYRDYLFFEVEPTYNWRIDEPFDDRRGAWQIKLRVEFLLMEELRRDAKASDSAET